LDHHATTPVDPRVAAVVMRAMSDDFGNSNSVEHLYGEMAAEIIADARREVAASVGADVEGVHFTSGSTESIRLAMAHAVSQCRHLPLRIALSTVEHRAVLDAVAAHEARGEAIATWLPVDSYARLELRALEDVCLDGIDLVCVMAANNEVGTIYPIQEVARIAGRVGARILVDATQAVGRIPINVSDWEITYLAASAHKIYGPKGIGALVVSPVFEMRPDHGHSPGTGTGTPNVPGIAGFGEACRLRRIEMVDDESRMATQRDRLEALLRAQIEGLLVNGDVRNRLSNNLHITIPDIPNDAILARLRHHVAVSTGAACSSGADTPSHVLRAMGLSPALRESVLRISSGKFTTDEEIEHAAAHIIAAVTAVVGVMRTAP